MSIFDITSGERIAAALERIAAALDRAVPPLPTRAKGADEDATLINSTTEQFLAWERQEEAAQKGHPEREGS